ncbi:MAG: ABC transporter permease [Porphyromonadaceae bacterium]|nr:ABC transporter permease [Porphyromonadaceae bacterium]
MRVLWFVLRKEFILIFRDKMVLFMILAMPVFQLIVLPFAADLDVRYLKITVVDNDQSSYSRRLTSKIASTDLFSLYDVNSSYETAMRQIGKNEIDMILQIPPLFERDLVRNGEANVSVMADAINGVKAGLGTSYLNSILMNFNSQIAVEWLGEEALRAPVDIKYSFWYNPLTSYRNYMVPGILVLLITTICGLITTLMIVKEKEIGTIEQINVTPLKRTHFVIGKLVPFWIIGVFVYTLGLLITRVVYNIHIEGNIGTLYLFGVVYISGILGFGLLVSTISNTQQQAMFISYFFIMIFIMLSGLFTNIESMPSWAYVLANIIPMTHFMHAVRAIIIKGSGFMDIWQDMVYIVAFSVVVIGAAVANYRKRS